MLRLVDGSRRDQRGATAVEFALVSGLLLMLVFGVVEFGRAIWMQQGVSAASREASRWGVATGLNSGVPQYRDCAGIRAAAKAKAPDMKLTDADISVTYELYASASPSATPSPTATPTCSTASPAPVKDGDMIVVRVRKKIDVNLPLVPLPSFTAQAVDKRSIYLGSTP